MRGTLLGFAATMVAGCSGGTPDLNGSGSPPDIKPVACVSDNDCVLAPAAPQCVVYTGACAPRAWPLGTKDGSPMSVVLTLIYQAASKEQPTGLVFNPDAQSELWVVSRKNDYTTIIYNPGESNTTTKRLHDPDAAHFMHYPTGIAFGTKKFDGQGTWGTCGESDNPIGGDNNFMGPALFSSDLSIFAMRTANGLGSHLDMLHDSPFCMGIAYENGNTRENNVYWVFDGEHGSLARYNFNEFHESGGDDHTDGEIRQYVMGEVLRVASVPSHLVFNPADRMLYAADTGNRRIVKLDTTTGTPGGDLPTLEPVVPQQYDGATLSDLVPPGTLEAPSGLALDDGILYVTDNATSRIYAFEISGMLVRKLDTGLPAGSLAGLTIGPDGRIYFVDMLMSRVYRIDLLPS